MQGEKLAEPVPVDQIFSISNEAEFERIALQVFHFQFHNNPLYGEWCRLTGRVPERVHSLSSIPFLPVSFFKSHPVITGKMEPRLVFQSSGTTARTTSRHYVAQPSVYRESFLRSFQMFYGDPSNYCILALLPEYGRHGTSSLLYMVDELIRLSAHPESAFVPDKEIAERVASIGQKQLLLLGVSWALYDLALDHPMQLPEGSVVMETGGMKGRSKELTRMEIGEVIKKGFGVPMVHGEYGMTELLSQAYGKEGIFQTPPWMKILLRDETDPFALADTSGAINIIDLANLYSCSFIATDDQGRKKGAGVEILGRLDHSDVRGCALLI